MERIKKIIRPSYEANIRRTFVRAGLNALAFFLPTWVLFLQENLGLSLSEIVFVEIVFGLTSVLMEIPTGAVADVIGRKASLIVGSVCIAVAAVWFGLAPTLGWVIAAHVLWGIAFSFDSGADMALFYESLQQLGREDEYVKLRGRLSMVRVGSAAVGSIIGGFIGAWHLAAPMLAYGAVNILALFVTLGLLEPPYQPDPETGLRIKYRDALLLAYNTLRERPALRAMLLFAATSPTASYLPAVLLIQPYAMEIGIPIAMMGFISFGYQISRFMGASATERLQTWGGTQRMLYLAPPLLLAGLLALAVFPSWVGIVLSFSLGFVVMAIVPIIENMILQEIPEQIRATLLSVNRLFYRGIVSIFELGVGFIGERMGLRISFLWAGIFIFALLEFSLYRWWQASKRTSPVAEIAAP